MSKQLEVTDFIRFITKLKETDQWNDLRAVWKLGINHETIYLAWQQKAIDRKTKGSE